MNKFKDWILGLVEAYHAVRNENLRWRTANQKQQTQLKHAQVLAENDLADQLKIKRAQLEHELARLQTQHQADLTMFKSKCKQDIKDYQDYLAALAQLKTAIQRRYHTLPDALAFTIHHHAKQLLNLLWEAQDLEQKIHCEIQLINFMTAIQDDASRISATEVDSLLPAKTLELLKHTQH